MIAGFWVVLGGFGVLRGTALLGDWGILGLIGVLSCVIGFFGCFWYFFGYFGVLGCVIGEFVLLGFSG